MSEKAWAIDEVEKLNLSSQARKNRSGTMPSASLNSELNGCESFSKKGAVERQEYFMENHS